MQQKSTACFPPEGRGAVPFGSLFPAVLLCSRFLGLFFHHGQFHPVAGDIFYVDGQAVALTGELLPFIGHPAHNPADHAVPYPGIPELLESLKGRGIRLGIVSNKDDGIVQAIVSKFFPSVFDFVSGQIAGTPLKPDPMLLLSALEKVGAAVDESVYVGDSEVDAETGKRAGVRTLVVSYGFRSPEELADAGIKADAANCERQVKGSIGIVTALNPIIGYKNSTKIAKEAVQTGKGVYDLVLEHDILSKEDLDTILKPENMIAPVKLDIKPKH